MKHRLLTLAALCCIAGSAAAAGPIYRCGADGRVFSQTPCAGGTPIDATVAEPSAERQAEARRVAEQDRRLADEMERSRLAEEAALRPRRAAALTRPARQAETRNGEEHAHPPRLHRKPTKKKSRQEERVILLGPAARDR